MTTDLAETIATWRRTVGALTGQYFVIEGDELRALLDAAEAGGVMHFTEAQRIRDAALEECEQIALLDPRAEPKTSARRIRSLRRPT